MNKYNIERKIIIKGTNMKKIILILIVTSSALTLNSGASKNRERQLFNTILTEDNVEIVRDLIQNGVKINIIHDLYSSPLILAIKQNRPNILKLLLENGANPNTKDLTLYCS
jgi:ankyrin repeat protein